MRQVPLFTYFGPGLGLVSSGLGLSFGLKNLVLCSSLVRLIRARKILFTYLTFGKRRRFCTEPISSK